MVRSRQGHHWLVGKRPRSVIYVWTGRRLEILTETRHGLDLPGSPGAHNFSVVAYRAYSQQVHADDDTGFG